MLTELKKTQIKATVEAYKKEGYDTSREGSREDLINLMIRTLGEEAREYAANIVYTRLPDKGVKKPEIGTWVNQITGDGFSGPKPGDGWVTKTIYDATRKKEDKKVDTRQSKADLSTDLKNNVVGGLPTSLLRKGGATGGNWYDPKANKFYDMDKQKWVHDMPGSIAPKGTGDDETGDDDTGSGDVSAGDAGDDGALDNKWAKMLTGETAEIYSQWIAMVKDGTVVEQKAWMEALTIAGEQSDLYFGEQLNIFKDAFSDAMGTLTSDLEAREKDLTVRTQRLKDDLETQKGDLSIEQSAELARRIESYDITLENTRNIMASRGLSSSSIRSQAEERLATSQEDIIESTKRSYARSLRSAELTESRGLEDVGRAQKELTRNVKEGRTSAVKTAEQYWGTDKLKSLGTLGGLNLSDYAFGGVSQGTVGQSQVTDIAGKVNTLLMPTYG